MRGRTHYNPIERLLEGLEGFVLDFLESQRQHSQKPSHADIAEMFVSEVDKMIIHGVTNEGMQYVGGKFYFELGPDDEHFGIYMELYFQQAGEWVCKSWRSGKLALSLLLLDSRTKLKRDKRIEYEAVNPLEE